ncbi:MAG: type II toxin-antitoxin system RelE/ParE family toxin [Planctomycetaceae bacterium]|nr:type II toxin-antitoxin system RelE/ParE family toxin [Planctomycetaceae bacterium]
MSRLVIRERADQDIDEQLIYLARQSHRIAERFLDAVERTFQILAESPERGFVWNSDGMRVWSVRSFHNWLIFYLPVEDGVDIIRVLHGARDLAALLDDES